MTLAGILQVALLVVVCGAAMILSYFTSAIILDLFKEMKKKR